MAIGIVLVRLLERKASHGNRLQESVSPPDPARQSHEGVRLAKWTKCVHIQLAWRQLCQSSLAECIFPIERTEMAISGCIYVGMTFAWAHNGRFSCIQLKSKTME